MARNRIEDLLSVNWFDGLLVNRHHFSQSDRRMDGLLGEACGALLDQPGLFGEEAGGRTPHPLIEIESQTVSDEGIDIGLNVTRGFRAFAPAGNLILGIPNAQARFGVPATTIRTRLSAQDRSGSGKEFILWARQEVRSDLKIEKKVDGDSGIELGYPGLAVGLVEAGDFKRRVVSEFSDAFAIARLGLAGTELVVDTEYVPPVVRLESVSSFDDGLMPALGTLLQDLYRLSFDLVQTSSAALSAGQIGADLLSRHLDYETLRTFLLGGVGLIRGVGRVSPARLLRDVIVPVATWWRQYYERQFKQASGTPDHSPVRKLYDLANALTEVGYADLCAGSGDFLRSAKKFIEGLNQELGMIG